MNRTQLALAACEGMTDEDLMKRGQSGFPKMIERKRGYAHIARELAKENDMLKKELELAKATINTLDVLTAPVTDTTQANDILKSLFKH